MPALFQPRSLALLIGGAALGLLLNHLLAGAGVVAVSSCLPLRALLWPGAAVVVAALLARAVVVVARLGIRVEIFTRSPIDIGTQRRPIQAAVTKVRL
ncbi:hypothetical protein [Cyanobium sp. LEGE 06113]|uniref:hypothetical protein n=1 Tax=Cyanobium sp. LEGE 06113 TaxID=1297573 RepID=UPI001D1362D5|nr:hypothetical protein [Cyanobium sp. LEGE 06113]